MVHRYSSTIRPFLRTRRNRRTIQILLDRNNLKKNNGLRTKTYIDSGFVLSVLNYFGVLKGETDICMVFDATKCELNAALWTPNFFLATIESVMMNADAETWMGDLDLGEMFLNLWLDEQLRPYAGVDVTSLGKRELGENQSDYLLVISVFLDILGELTWILCGVARRALLETR